MGKRDKKYIATQRDEFEYPDLVEMFQIENPTTFEGFFTRLVAINANLTYFLAANDALFQGNVYRQSVPVKLAEKAAQFVVWYIAEAQKNIDMEEAVTFYEAVHGECPLVFRISGECEGRDLPWCHKDDLDEDDDETMTDEQSNNADNLMDYIMLIGTDKKATFLMADGNILSIDMPGEYCEEDWQDARDYEERTGETSGEDIYDCICDVAINGGAIILCYGDPANDDRVIINGFASNGEHMTNMSTDELRGVLATAGNVVGKGENALQVMYQVSPCRLY